MDSGEDTRAISERIRSARVNLGLSQTELAKAIGVNRATVGHWERGGAFAPSRAHLQALSTTLQVSLDWLANGEQGRMVAVVDTAGPPSSRAVAEEEMLELSRQLPMSFVAQVVALMASMKAYF
ncbi:helix-turn-helix domain-containing protein [uncultured Stenotrophomonas sp.]|mgnify:CR=1 FL=1|uniref:helix-turn-helix domain-containing protein n=1 Tax=uncultured Stenotrophomonas sp. TaxID=165438 RepID=UPI0025D03E8B|nr:helix-turn-helix domain-containing protein [uncultured Stenotrophomonas sp.]